MDNLQISYLGEKPPPTTTTTTTKKATSTIEVLTTTDENPETKTTPNETPVSSQATPTVNFSSAATNALLGIFLPAILIALIVLIVLYWRRSKEILKLLTDRQSESIKFSTNKSEIVFRKPIVDTNEQTPISNDFE